MAELTRTGDFLGAFSLMAGMPEFEALSEALEFTHRMMPGRESIVLSSIVAAGRGEFGDVHSTERTKGTELYINPLMALYYAFRLQGVAERCLYLDYIKNTHSRMDVHRALSNFLYTVKPRPWVTFPH